MKLKIAVIGIVLIAACLSGCVNKNTMDGTYRCEANGVLYLGEVDHLGEGTYRILVDEVHGCGGTYGVEDGKVLLDSVFNTVIPLTIDGRDLIDPDGDRWVRD